MNRDICIFLAQAFSDDIKQDCLKDLEKKDLKNNICGFCHRAKAVFQLKKAVPSTLLLRGFFYSDGLCYDCAFVLKYGFFRKNNYIIEKGAEYKVIKHGDIWDNILMKVIDPPSFISLTTSYKKHNIFWGEINRTDSDIRYIVYNQHEIKYSIFDDKKYFDIVNSLYNDHKQTKEAIETGNISSSQLSEEEYKQVRDMYRQISDKRGTYFMNLLTTYVPKREKK